MKVLDDASLVEKWQRRILAEMCKFLEGGSHLQWRRPQKFDLMFLSSVSSYVADLAMRHQIRTHIDRVFWVHDVADVRVLAGGEGESAHSQFVPFVATVLAGFSFLHKGVL